MGIYDRDYYGDNSRRGFGMGSSSGFGRSPFSGSRIGRFREWSFTTWIIVINVAIFLLDIILFRFGVSVRLPTPPGVRPVFIAPLTYWGEFSLDAGIIHGEVWRFITFQFLHAGIMHIGINMLVLFFFGPIAEAYLGSKRYLAFYLLSGMAGALFYCILNVGGLMYGNLPFLLPNSPQSTLVGASAGIFAVLMAAAFIRPNDVVTLLIMFIIPVRMKIKTLAYGLVALAVLTVFMNGNNAGGEAGHLGGAMLGFFLIRHTNLLNWAASLPNLNPFSRSKPRNPFAPQSPSYFEKRKMKKTENLDQEVDRILAKVGTQGLQSLTNREKKILEQASEQQRRNAG